MPFSHFDRRCFKLYKAACVHSAGGMSMQVRRLSYSADERVCVCLLALRTYNSKVVNKGTEIILHDWI